MILVEPRNRERVVQRGRMEAWRVDALMGYVEDHVRGWIGAAYVIEFI